MNDNALVTQGGNELAQPTETAIIQVIERLALAPNVDPDRIEKLLALQERMMDRQARNDFIAAMARMQPELPEIAQNGKLVIKDKLISTYAKWEDINEAIKPIIGKHGFSLTFSIETSEKVRVTGILSHIAGHSERTEITLPVDVGGSKNPVQAVKSSVSYGKRCTAEALLNITSRGDDDDGNSAGVETIDANEVTEIKTRLAEVGGDEVAYLAAMKASSFESIQKAAYRDALDLIERKRQKMEMAK